jgi:hypothetical protein
MSPTPPPSVVRDLKAKDPTLRLRWGPCEGLWHLEKKLDARHPSVEKERPNPLGTSPRARDLWPGYRDAYVNVLLIHPDLCNSRVLLEALRRIDFQEAGGQDALNLRLDAEQAAEDARLDRQLDTFVEAGSRELYDRAQWIGKRKIQVPNDEVAVERITPVVQADGFVIRDRRVSV